MTGWLSLLPALVACLTGLTVGWHAQGARLERVEAAFATYRAQAESNAARAEAARADLELRWERNADDAKETALLRQARIDLERTALGRAVDGLRRDNAALRARPGDAPAAARAVPATTLLGLYEECVDQYQALAGQAQGHVSDIESLIAAWPVALPLTPDLSAGVIPRPAPATASKED